MAALAFAAAIGGCAEKAAVEERAKASGVISSGKEETALGELPDDVVSVAMAARPDMEIMAAEYETRNGAEYYDVAGTVAGGSEVELDMTRIDGVWTVVEIQRDIAEGETPAAALDVLFAERPGFKIDRIIESDQGDGVIIYEFFQHMEESEPEKAEVKVEAGRAEFLTEEWAH